MKYFVIHSRSDVDDVKELISKWSELYHNVQFIMLEGLQSDWEGDATARIRECGKVLYIVGEASAKSPFIQIELDIAERENKDIYVYKLKADNPVNKCLTRNTNNSNSVQGEYEGETVIGKTRERIFILKEDELIKRMTADSKEIELILKGGDFGDKQIIMEQYKMFVQTSEDLVKRKQSVNTFYVTLNSLMLSTIVSIFCAAEEFSSVMSNGSAIYAVAAFLSVIGMVICCSWITLLNSYADLNASKMDIINCIEENLALKLFDTEWALLTRRIGRKKYRSFTVKELAVARIFLILYVLLGAACVFFIF